jgi:methyl-accepting chemotaxis protein
MPGKSSPTEGIHTVQHIVASLIPTAAVLLLGAYGSQQVKASDMLFFTVIFLLAAIFTFIGEQQVILFLQDMARKETSTYYWELTTVCRDFLAGNVKIRAQPNDKQKMANLAEAINQLLERQLQLQQQMQQMQQTLNSRTHANTNPNPAPKATLPAILPQNKEAELIKKQLSQIITDFAPIGDGDLRVKTSVSGDLIGVIADTFNSFIEELTQFVKWTRYASQVVITTSQNVLSHSIEMAKNTENQMHRLSNTTNNIEEIVVFIQHLSNSLHLSFEISKGIQTNLQETVNNSEQPLSDPLAHLIQEMQRQTELLEGMIHSTEETSTLAESMIGDLYSVAQQIYHSSIGALKTVERLSELETLAQRWQQAATPFIIEEDKDKDKANEPWLL